jgi:hypothetical protein
MGAGRGQGKRVQSVSTKLRGLREGLQTAKMVLGGAYRISQGELPDSHIETRFHPSEIELLDEYAARNNCLTRSDALLHALHKQSAKIQASPPMTRQELRSLARESAGVGRSETIEELLSNTVVLSAELSDEDCDLVKRYWERTGCQTAFGVPRHAFISELIEEGVLPQSVQPPLGFTPEPVRTRPLIAAGLLP